MSRPKGTPNYKTQALVPLVDQLKALNWDIVKDLYQLYATTDSEELQASILMKLLDYVYPKKRQIEVTERPNKEQLAEWVREYLNEGSDRSIIPVVPHELPKSNE